MKTTREKIEVMQAAEAGAMIEILIDGVGRWATCPSPPFWNWGMCDYRVAVPAKKKIFLFKALLKGVKATHFSESISYYESEKDARLKAGEGFVRLLPHTRIEVEVDA